MEIQFKPFRYFRRRTEGRDPMIKPKEIRRLHHTLMEGEPKKIVTSRAGRASSSSTIVLVPAGFSTYNKHPVFPGICH
jgi:hypothetical protein